MPLRIPTIQLKVKSFWKIVSRKCTKKGFEVISKLLFLIILVMWFSLTTHRSEPNHEQFVFISHCIICIISSLALKIVPVLKFIFVWGYCVAAIYKYKTFSVFQLESILENYLKSYKMKITISDPKGKNTFTIVSIL